MNSSNKERVASVVVGVVFECVGSTPDGSSSSVYERVITISITTRPSSTRWEKEEFEYLMQFAINQ
jgi:hypothetical protein